MKTNEESSRFDRICGSSGVHCIVTGFCGILAVILIGFLALSLGFPKALVYSILGGGLLLSLAGPLFFMNKKPE